MNEFFGFWYIVISIASIFPVFFFLRRQFLKRAGYAPFIIILLIWIYNIFGFFRYGLNVYFELDEKFPRYLYEYGADRLYGHGSLFIVVFMFYVLLTSYGFGLLASKRIFNDINRVSFVLYERNFFRNNIVIWFTLLLLSIYVIKDSLTIMLAQASYSTTYEFISEGIENYSIHSMFFRLSCITALFSFAISHSKNQLLITFVIIGIMFVIMALLGQRNEIALLFMSMLLIYINRRKIRVRTAIVVIFMLAFIRYIEIIRDESFDYIASSGGEVFTNFALAIATFWQPVLFGAETVFTHFSNLTILDVDLIKSPLQRFWFWILALIPNVFEIPRGETSYALLKNSLGLPDERGYNISIFSSSVHSFGLVGGFLFILIFGFIAGRLTTFFHQSSSVTSLRGIAFSVTLSVFLSYLFIINRSGIDNMKPLIFYTVFSLFYGMIATKRFRIYPALSRQLK